MALKEYQKLDKQFLKTEAALSSALDTLHELREHGPVERVGAQIVRCRELLKELQYIDDRRFAAWESYWHDTSREAIYAAGQAAGPHLALHQKITELIGVRAYGSSAGYGLLQPDADVHIAELPTDVPPSPPYSELLQERVYRINGL